MAFRTGWAIKQLYVRSNIFNKDLIKEVYMRQPKGFEVKGAEKHLCLLKNTICFK